MIELGLSPPTESYKRHEVMGKVFDPAKPDEYVKGFAIRRS
jgi:nitrate/nitrite transport system substrate-binding protein